MSTKRQEGVMKERDDQKFMRACAKFVLGESTGVSIKGSPDRRAALQEALSASKALFEALMRREGLDAIKPLLERKRAAAKKFKKEIGIPWIL